MKIKASRSGQTICVEPATGAVVHVTFMLKPPRSMLEDLRGLGKWSWKKRHWSVGGTVTHLARLFKALAFYLDKLALEGSVTLTNRYEEWVQEWAHWKH